MISSYIYIFHPLEALEKFVQEMLQRKVQRKAKTHFGEEMCNTKCVLAFLCT